MTGFGRKGLEQQQGLGHPQTPPAQASLDSLRNRAGGPFLSQPGNGRMSPSVDAFIAAERARNAQAASGGGISDVAAGYRSNDRPERSLLLAYLLWFILGQVSAHRFYLGAYRSAIAQVSLFAIALLIAINSLGSSYYALGVVMAIAMIGWALWVLGDVFFIHRIHRKFCRKPGEVASVFA